MGPAFYIMAILGCGDAGGQCEQVRVEQARYATADACFAASTDALTAASDLAFPVVTAECRGISAAQAASYAAPTQPEG